MSKGLFAWRSGSDVRWREQSNARFQPPLVPLFGVPGGWSPSRTLPRSSDPNCRTESLKMAFAVFSIHLPDLPRLCDRSEPAENTCQLPRFHIMPRRKMLFNQDHGAYRPRDRGPSRPHPDRERMEKRQRAEARSRPARPLPRDRDSNRKPRRRASLIMRRRQDRNHRLR
jgi:hypothetical protein